MTSNTSPKPGQTPFERFAEAAKKAFNQPKKKEPTRKREGKKRK